MSDSKFKCSGCGERYDVEPSLEITRGLLYLEGDRRRIDGGRYCFDCVSGVFGEADE